MSTTGTSSPSKNDESTPTWIIWSATSYVIITLFIGLPMWWKTTAVQRVFLPYQQMLESKNYIDNNFKIKITVELNGFTVPSSETTLLGQSENDFPGFIIEHYFQSTPANILEIIYKTEDIYDVDAKLCELSNGGNVQSETFHVYYVGRADLFKKYGRKVIFGNCRNAYYISNTSRLRPNILKNLYNKLIPSNRDEKFQLPLSLGYEVLFSVLVPNPERFNYVWHITSRFDEYAKAILGGLSEFATITARSQYLYYSKLNVKPTYDKSSAVYQISHDQLPLVINPVEHKLSSFVSQNTVLNFVVYTAPCEEYPLHLVDSDGVIVPSNSFLVPQWGGIQVYNADCGNGTATSSVDNTLRLKDIMTVVSFQLRTLVGASVYATADEILHLHKSAFREWEIDLINRKRLRNLLYTSANTLHSLGELLDHITNIVVTEEVGLEVEKSVQAIMDAVKCANDGRLSEALRTAKTAFKSSEVAFHHPTNLAQLYFPNEPKRAIYILMFLTFGIPVMLSLPTIFTKFSRK